MTIGRSLIGRTSFLWATGLVIFGGFTVAGAAIVAWPFWREGSVAFPRVPYFRWPLGMLGLLAGYAVLYFALEEQDRVHRRGLIGAVHFAATLGGMLLVWAPTWFGMIAPRAFGSLGETCWRKLDDLQFPGFDLIILGQVFFVAVLITGFRRAPNPR